MRRSADHFAGCGEVRAGHPEDAGGGAFVSLDSETAELVPAHLTMLKRRRLAAGGAYTDHKLMFCREDGTPLTPDSVSEYFKRLPAAGVPVA